MDVPTYILGPRVPVWMLGPVNYGFYLYGDRDLSRSFNVLRLVGCVLFILLATHNSPNAFCIIQTGGVFRILSHCLGTRHYHKLLPPVAATRQHGPSLPPVAATRQHGPSTWPVNVAVARPPLLSPIVAITHRRCHLAHRPHPSPSPVTSRHRRSLLLSPSSAAAVVAIPALGTSVSVASLADCAAIVIAMVAAVTPRHCFCRCHRHHCFCRCHRRPPHH